MIEVNEMSRLGEFKEAQKKIDNLLENYPEYYDPQNIMITYLCEIAKSLAVIADRLPKQGFECE